MASTRWKQEVLWDFLFTFWLRYCRGYFTDHQSPKSRKKLPGSAWPLKFAILSTFSDYKAKKNNVIIQFTQVIWHNTGKKKDFPFSENWRRLDQAHGNRNEYWEHLGPLWGPCPKSRKCQKKPQLFQKGPKSAAISDTSQPEPLIPRIPPSSRFCFSCFSASMSIRICCRPRRGGLFGTR